MGGVAGQRERLLRAGSVADKMRAMFGLRSVGAEDVDQAVAALGECLESGASALVRHEAAYVIGQMGSAAGLGVLERVLRAVGDNPMVRHEAAEAMAAIGSEESLPVLREFLDDEERVVAETCVIAVRTIEDKLARRDGLPAEAQSDLVPNDVYTSMDPAPPRGAGKSVEQLRAALLDRDLHLFERYEAMFALRNRGGSDAVAALCEGLFDPASALLRHEVAYVLGQMADPESVNSLHKVLLDESENEMVRHEAAEALGSVATPACSKILEGYRNDQCVVVRESCQVALDIADYYASEELEYVPETSPTAT